MPPLLKKMMKMKMDFLSMKTVTMNDESVNPDAEEICDEIDNNCDGIIDEGVTSFSFIDNDGDGFGSDEQYHGWV